MSQDSYVQVAADGAGKKISMDQTVDAAGNTTYLQRAVIYGESNDLLFRMAIALEQLLAVQRAMLRMLTETSDSMSSEEDFVP